MASPEPGYPTTASPGYSKTVDIQEDDLKFTLMKMMEALK